MKKQRGVIAIFLVGAMFGGILGWGFATQYTDGKRVHPTVQKSTK